MSGYCATGSLKTETAPIKTSTMAMTFASTGCSMKCFENMAAPSGAARLLGSVSSACCAYDRNRPGCDLPAGDCAVRSGDHDLVVWLQSRGYDTQLTIEFAKLDSALLHFVIGTHHEQVAAFLVLLQDSVGDQQRISLRRAHWHAEPHEHAGEQRPVLVLELSSHEECGRLRVDLGGRVVDLALMGKAFFVHQANFDRDLLKLGQ